MNKNILGVITARKGSKRLVNKNKLLLGGKTLIEWTFNVVQKAKGITNVIVSTDDVEIAEIAKKYNLLVPWLRPKNLCTDKSNSVDVVLHSLKWYEVNYGKADAVILLQPTSPFRAVKTIEDGINMFFNNECKPIVSVFKARSNPRWMFKIVNEKCVPIFSLNNFKKRSQDLPDSYELTGGFYMIKPDELILHRSFINSSTMPLIINDFYEALDIDDFIDWTIAKSYLDNKK